MHETVFEFKTQLRGKDTSESKLANQSIQASESSADGRKSAFMSTCSNFGNFGSSGGVKSHKKAITSFKTSPTGSTIIAQQEKGRASLRNHMEQSNGFSG